MVCIRCKMVVKSELEKLGLHYVSVDLGEVDVIENISKEQLNSLGIALKKTGLELLDDNKKILVEKIGFVKPEIVPEIIEPVRKIVENKKEKVKAKKPKNKNKMSSKKPSGFNSQVVHGSGPKDP